MKTNPIAFVSSALPLVLGFCFAPTVGTAQDKPGTGSPVVSPTALNAVSAPATAPGAASPVAKGTSATGKADSVPGFPGKTDLDDPSNHDPSLFVPADRTGRDGASRLSKVDLDADLNYDGTFQNSDPSDQSINETVPPGLELGKGEVSRLLVRFKTYETDFTGDLVVTLSVKPVNRDSTTGEFASNPGSSVGRVRIWADQARKQLLVDSGDNAKSSFQWKFDKSQRTGGIPRSLYIEGVSVSPKFKGDVRVMVIASHSSGGAAPAPGSLYLSAFDHLVVTVKDQPVKKDFINNNVEGIWSSANGAQ